MKKLTTNEDVYALLHAPAACAALGAAITTGLLWMLADKPMSAEEVVQALKIPGKRGYYWLQYLQSFGILEAVPDGYVPSTVAGTALLDTHSCEIWQHLVIDEQEKDGCVHDLPQLICTPGSLWSIPGLRDGMSLSKDSAQGSGLSGESGFRDDSRVGTKNYVTKMRTSPDRAREFTRMLFRLHRPLADEVAKQLDLTGAECMMDLGGGSGVVSMALLRKYPALASTVVDIENVCIAGREIAREERLSDRISYYPAEFSDDELPSGFDLILQCDVGIFGKEILHKMSRSLRPGGRVIFVELFSPAENVAPAARLEWTFLDSLHDPDFSFPTRDEFKSQLAQAGFDVLHQPPFLIGGMIVIQAQKTRES